jgi:hypothetical protein
MEDPGFKSRQRRVIFSSPKRPDRLWGLLSQGLNGRSVILTIRIVGAVPLRHLYAFEHGLRRIFLLSGKGDMRCDVGIDRRVKVKLTYKHLKGTDSIQVTFIAIGGRGAIDMKISSILIQFLDKTNACQLLTKDSALCSWICPCLYVSRVILYGVKTTTGLCFAKSRPI